MDITIDPFEKIQEIASKCESVREYIDTQSYLNDTDSVDTLDEVGVLTQCCLILIDELKRKGILFISDTEELLSSISYMDEIFKFYLWIDIKHQIDFCKNHKKIIPYIENIIENCETDYIVELYNCQSEIDPTLSKFDRIIDSIKSTDTFKDYLNYIFNKISDIEFEFTQSQDVIMTYISTMYNGQKNAIKAFEYLMKDEMFQQYIDHAQVSLLLKHLNKYDTEKLQPTCISKYAWAWTIETGYKDALPLEVLPEYVQELYHKLEYEHHTSTDHHIEYYLANKDIPLDAKAVVLLSIACYKPSEPDKTKTSAEKVLQYGGDRFTSDTKKLFIHFANCLIRLSKQDILSNQSHIND